LTTEKEAEARHSLVTHACNPGYLGGFDQEGRSSKPAWANSSQDPISKITRVKWTRGMAHAVEHLLCKHKALSSNFSPTKKREEGERGMESETLTVTRF
jgi:hypothetical protein